MPQDRILTGVSYFRIHSITQYKAYLTQYLNIVYVQQKFWNENEH